MDRKITRDLMMALPPWLTEAMALIRQKPDLMIQMRNCMDGYGDVRVVFHVGENATTVEVVDSSTVLGVLSPSLSPKTVASRCTTIGSEAARLTSDSSGVSKNGTMRPC